MVEGYEQRQAKGQIVAVSSQEKGFSLTAGEQADERLI
jgi:hypothetical protein